MIWSLGLVSESAHVRGNRVDFVRINVRKGEAKNWLCLLPSLAISLGTPTVIC